MHNPHLKRWLHRIDIPTLLLWGEQDGIVRPSYGEAWRAEIPGARMDVISNAGHFPHWEQPRGFADRLIAFHRHRLRSAPMRCWYFSEMAYHPAWEAGLARGTLRVVLPSSNFDPPTGAWPAEPLSRRVRAVRRGRARHHGERAPQHGDLHDGVGADGAGDHCT